MPPPAPCLAWRAPQEYVPHTKDVAALALHHEGSLLLSADTGGTWMLHLLLPPQTYAQHAAALMASPRHHPLYPSARSSTRARASHAAHAALGGDDGELTGATGRGAGMAPLPPHHLLAPMAQSAWLAGVLPGAAKGGATLPDAALDVVTVRSSEMQLLKESVR